MQTFIITGFTKHGVWATIEIRTIKECINIRAAERGLIDITNVHQV